MQENIFLLDKMLENITVCRVSPFYSSLKNEKNSAANEKTTQS